MILARMSPMIPLTEEQQQAIDSAPGPARLLDPRTNQTYVLIRAETYERIKGLLVEDSALTMRQVAALVERAMREDDLNDPTLAFYEQNYGTR
jgi:hypothetical protein